MNPIMRTVPDAATFVQASILRGPVVHGFSTRQGGVSQGPFAALNLGQSVGDDTAAVQENRRRFFGRFGIEREHVVRVKQVHGDRVLVVDEPLMRRPHFPGALIEEPAEYDGLVTHVPGLALTVSTADCVPVLVHDPIRRAVAAIHAGWRGTAAGIAARAVETMTGRYGTRAEELQVAIGPAIRRCCYEVDRPVFDALVSAVPGAEAHFVPAGQEHWTVDLPALNRATLEAAGVPADHIEDLGLCTACRRDLFFSHRADRGRTGRMMNFILLLPAPESDLPPDARQVREAEQQMSWEGGPPEQSASGQPYEEKHSHRRGAEGAEARRRDPGLPNPCLGSLESLSPDRLCVLGVSAVQRLPVGRRRC